MLRSASRLRLILLPVLVACDDTVVQPPGPEYELGGTYQGSVLAATEGAALDALVGLEVEHEAGLVTGTYTISGEVVYADGALQIGGVGTLTGTVTPGDQPGIAIFVRTPICPTYEGSFVGRFEPATGRLVLGGAVDIFEDACAVLVSFEVVMFLSQ
jgi:hypothetical protein